MLLSVHKSSKIKKINQISSLFKYQEGSQIAEFSETVLLPSIYQVSFDLYLWRCAAFHRRRHETRHSADEEEETGHKEWNIVTSRCVVHGSSEWRTDDSSCASK